MALTPQEFTEKLRDLYGLVGGDLAELALAKPAYSLFKDIRKRIFTEGKNSSDSNIGQYSVKPMYVAKEMFAKPGAFSPRGKKGEVGDKLVPTYQLKRGAIKPTNKQIKNYSVVKADNKPRKTMYLPQGYKELRDIQALRTDIVDLTYRGDLKKDFAIEKDGQSYLIGFKTKPESLKRLALERQFGPIFYATQQERNKYIQAASFSLNRLTVGTLNGQTITPTFE